MTDTLVYGRTDPRLGRYVRHDPRSRAFDLARHVTPILPAERIEWERNGPIFDQLDLGCCTACAALGLMMTGPFSDGTVYSLDDVHDFYRAETRIDGIRGVWEPDDTGSSSLAAMKTLRRWGKIREYSHAFSPTVAVAALRRGPISVGSVWLDSMMSPRRGSLVVDWTSPVAGGHEYLITAWDPGRRRLRVTNSWSEAWGDGGSAWLDLGDFAALLRQGGDAVQPTVLP